VSQVEQFIRCLNFIFYFSIYTIRGVAKNRFSSSHTEHSPKGLTKKLMNCVSNDIVLSDEKF